MYAVMGVTGQVGGAVARALLGAGQPVRAIVREGARGAAWAALGCEVAVADLDNVDALAAAFGDVAGGFVMLPPLFDPSPGFPEAQSRISSLVTALRAGGPGNVVALSTIGADVVRPNLLNQLGMLEHALAALAMPVTCLRPAWFMENASWDVVPARTGVIHSYLQPLDRRIPMVATQDVGATAAALLQEAWSGQRVVELEGPRRYAPDDLAAAFARALGTAVRVEAVPRETWEGIFRGQGMSNPAPRVQMLEGFGEGWIDFPDRGVTARKGTITLDDVVGQLVARHPRE